MRAGAEILETNTFGANPIKLAQHGLSDETERINETAARLAREAAGDRASVVGAIGPLGIRIEPFGVTSATEARDAFGRQVDGLLAGGVDGFILETFSDVDEIRAAYEAVRSRTDLPVVAQMTVGLDGKTYYGTEPATFGPLLQAMGADVVGVNCSVGPQGILEVVEQLAKVVTVPISAQPNAGQPREVGDRKMYMASPEYMAEYARRIVEAGARFVGGCCGTTPEHIKAMVGFVKSVAPRHSAAFGAKPATAVPLEPVPLVERSQFGAKLARKEFITTVEIVPPKGVDPAPMFDQVRELKAAGVDAVNVPDGPRAQSRMGALLSGLLIQRELGMEPVVHYACRDRNLLGMLSDLLGAAASGLNNLLIVTGDPPKMGPYPDATAVFDIDSIGLTNLVSRLNHGLDPGGNPLGGKTRFVIGVGVNPAAAGRGPGTQALRLEGRGGRGVRHHPAGVRPGPARSLPAAGRAIQGPDHRRDLAAGLAPQRRVPGQRGAGCDGAAGDSGPDAGRVGQGEGGGPRRRSLDRAGDAGGGADPGERCAGGGAAGAGGGGGAGD